MSGFSQWFHNSGFDPRPQANHSIHRLFHGAYCGAPQKYISDKGQQDLSLSLSLILSVSVPSRCFPARSFSGPQIPRERERRLSDLGNFSYFLFFIFIFRVLVIWVKQLLFAMAILRAILQQARRPRSPCLPRSAGWLASSKPRYAVSWFARQHFARSIC